MRPTEYPPRRRGTRDSGTVPIGPAMTTLRSVIARLASVVRCAGIVYIAVQVAIWPSFFTADPGRLAGPVAAAFLLVMVASVHVYGRPALYRRAAAADAALAQADWAAREQYVILSRNIERREHERLLHDTALNTLTALARAGIDDRGDVAE